MRIPGRRGGGGGAAFASEAAGRVRVSKKRHFRERFVLPMPLGSLGSTSVVALLAEPVDFGVWSPTMVEVDEERLKVLASGARCVSLSSRQMLGGTETDTKGDVLLVSFQDMVAAGQRSLGAERQTKGKQVETRESGGGDAKEGR